MADLLLYKQPMRLQILLPIALLLGLYSGVAGAQPGMSPPGQTAPQAYQSPPVYVQQPQELPTRTVGYGLHVFAADAATWVAIGVASDNDAEGIGIVGGFGLFLGGPLVHLAHGNNAGAGYSLLARTGLPLGGALLLAATCDDSDSWDCLGSTLAGGMLGYAGALVIDWFYLARKTEVIAAPTGWASLAPSVQLRDGGAQAGVAFNF